MNDNKSSSSCRERSKEFANRFTKVKGGFKHWLKMGGIFSGCFGVRRWRVKRLDWEFMDVNVFQGMEFPALMAAFGLADVSGGGNVVDGYVVKGNEAGEMQELA